MDERDDNATHRTNLVQSRSEKLEQYRGSKNLLRNHRVATRQLTLYITLSGHSKKGRRSRFQLLKKLSSFTAHITSNEEGAEISISRARYLRTKVPPSYTTRMHLLYHVLSTYATCSDTSILTQLRLRTMKSDQFQDGLALSVLFLTHPHLRNYDQVAKWRYTIVDMNTE